jgi:hypothetical protein
MPTTTTTDADQELTALTERFEHWRQTRRDTPTRIPPDLWESAVALARRLPYSQVAKRLRLSPQELKRRLTAPAAALATVPDFVEITLPPPTGAPATPAAEIEIERPDGTRMRLRYAEAPPLAMLLRAFLEPAGCCN